MGRIILEVALAWFVVILLLLRLIHAGVKRRVKSEDMPLRDVSFGGGYSH